MAGKRDDELARTATALPSARGPVAPAAPLGARLGRYHLERELGSGGMGAVHAAFDPDLERRIALKVLRAGSGSGDAERRLLREARAMARLHHPNVVTVHEVGSENGRDYIAMELVEGETLAEWLRAERRAPGAIIEAFQAAGRGLAAAHAAGIVHRDFKPHNVLRRTDGRIVVTDFGLAREAEDSVELAALGGPAGGPAPALGAAEAAATEAEARTSPLVGITVTGSLLGTPAYMAPEQWRGGAVTPATDQFAFCVALWEALAGDRPFHGATLDALRDAILRGPAELDTSRIPRRMRPILRRGLDPSPARRWPSMGALLAAMARAQRRPVLLVAVVGAALLAASIALHAYGRAPAAPVAAAAVCPATALDPDAVWSDTARRQLASRRPLEARALDIDFAAWTAARARACTSGDLATQAARHACLDAVLVRFDVVARAVEGLSNDVPAVEPGAIAIDPAVCDAARVPRLVATDTPQLREVAGVALRAQAAEPLPAHGELAKLVERVGGEPCAASVARTLLAAVTPQPSERAEQLAAAEQDAERCDDDRVRADVAVAVAHLALSSSNLSSAISAKVKSAEVAIGRVAQRDLTADVDTLRLVIAERANQLDEAIARGEAAVAGYAARTRIASQLAVGLALLRLRELRGRPDDLAMVPQLYEEWRAVGAAGLGESHPVVRRVDAELATRMFVRGDVAGAHARLERLRRPVPHDRARRMRGRVVDAAGRPVAGATVVAGAMLAGDAVSVAVPFPEGAPGAMRFATTGPDGKFVLEDAPHDGVVIAQLGAGRSAPAAIADEVSLALEPTSRIEGRVALNGEPASRLLVTVRSQRRAPGLRYELVAPLLPDGSFAVDGAPRGPVRVAAVRRNPQTQGITATIVDVRGPVVRGVQLAVSTSARVVHVIVRSTVGVPVSNAEVYVFPGHQPSTNALALNRQLRTMSFAGARQLEGERAPPPVVRLGHAGDLFATMSEVPEGPATACAVGLPPDLADRDLLRKVGANLAKIEVRCAPIPVGAEAVVVEVPPWPRLDR